MMYEIDFRVCSDLFERLSIPLKVHSIHAGMLSELLAKALIEELTYYYKDLKESDIVKAIKFGGIHHDVGKSMFSEMTLDSINKLTFAEREAIKWHPTRSAELVSESGEFKKLSYSQQKIVTECCLYHHERYDGSGYPYALTAESIPLSAQIVSLCDVLDALCSKRSYKESLSFSESCEIINEQSGRAFSKTIVKCFNNNRKEMQRLYDFLANDFSKKRGDENEIII